MKYQIIAIILTVLFHNNAMSQSIVENDTARFFKVFRIDNHQNTLRFFSIKDEHTFYFEKDAGTNSHYFMKDSVAVDSIKNQIFGYDFNLEESTILAYSGDIKNRTYFEVDLADSKIKQLEDINLELLGKYKDVYLIGQRQKAKYIDEMPYINNVVLYSAFKNKNVKEINLTRYLGESEGVTQVLVFEKQRLALLITALCYADGCENYKYTLYNFDDNNITKSVPSQVVNPSKIIKGTSGNNFFITQEHDYKNLYVSNVNLDKYDTVLSRNIDVIGKAVWDEDKLAYLFESNLDSKKHAWQRKEQRVIIPARVDFSLERAISRIYHNQVLEVETLSQFSLYDLLVLKNMIFAKHNYAFNSEYYQAFFNLYHFYNSKAMKASRTKDVNDKLTKVDIENLGLITKAIER